ncbi:LPXTG-site transpeptidase (sortase) family protein [Ruminococcaceae bacterium YAD3003]|nr:LPXTG-site transpeptidase (sortase) family protein [Ruminococcaceae bacterium YAD3003]
MKRIESRKAAVAKQKLIRSGLLILSIFLLVIGVVLLLIEPIKRMNRSRISNSALAVFDQKIAQSETELTYTVPRTGNEVEGEGYDFLGNMQFEETTPSEDEGEYVTLTSIGILNISSINCRYSVWDEASQVSLRYGLGHYVDSVMPGEAGNCTILGHNYRDGSMFHRLDEVQIGDTVEFTAADGTYMTFHVVENKVVSADEILSYALGSASSSYQLTLVTCTYENGEWYGLRRIVICEMD